jgi:CheY-like chemotaxis protein
MRSHQHAFATLNSLLNTAFVRIGHLIAPVRGVDCPVVPALVHEAKPFPRRPQVLVVDDHLENRLFLEALLHRWSITPIQAADGAEAVALACGQHFDLILMDLQMPVLNGLIATAQIRDFERRSAHPRAPIVAYSSSVLGDDWQTLRTCGFDESLDKPCSSQALEECLRRWCASGPSLVPSHLAPH